MNIQQLLFYDLFIYLKDELKIDLDFGQYEAFNQLLLVNNWNISADDEGTRNRLKNLCISLWIPQQKYRAVFEQKFDQLFATIFKNVQTLENKKVDHPTDIKQKEDANPKEDKPTKQDTNSDPSENTEEPLENTNDTADVEAEDTPVAPDEKNKPTYKNMFVDFSAGEGSSDLDSDNQQESSIRDTPYVFSDDKHLPLPSRKALQLWRKINTYSQRVEGKQIDVKATVGRFAKEGMLHEPVSEMEKKGKVNYLLFVEHDGPMIAFQSWWQQLEKNLMESNKNSQVKMYYFNNYPLPVRGEDYPDFHLFLNRSHTSSDRLSAIYQEINKETIVLFFSDAGALDGGANNNRVPETLKFIQAIQKNTRHLLWLNPIPKKDWSNSCAAILSMLVPMETYNFNGIEKGIKILRD